MMLSELGGKEKFKFKDLFIAIKNEMAKLAGSVAAL
jgi:hypothetical protein